MIGVAALRQWGRQGPEFAAFDADPSLGFTVART
jgi:hypothetical protein